MLADAGIPTKKIAGFDTAEFTHSAVAAFIASGMADVGFGVQTAAHRFGLDFIPLIRERYFFAIKSSALRDPLVRPVIDILQSASFREVVDALAGYDGTELGTILTCAEAFP
jgi:molybdate-binding protein